MQCLANACAGFLNVMNRERRLISVEQTASLISALQKFKDADMNGVDIQVVGALT